MDFFRKFTCFFFASSLCLGSQHVRSLTVSPKTVSLCNPTRETPPCHSSYASRYPKVLPVLDLQSGVEANISNHQRDVLPGLFFLPEMFKGNHPTLSLVGFGWKISVLVLMFPFSFGLIIGVFCLGGEKKSILYHHYSTQQLF